MKSLLLATFALAVAGFFAAWLLRRFKVESPLLHRFTWGLVLIQGLIFAGIRVELPLLEPDGPSPALIGEATLPTPVAERAEVSAPGAQADPQPRSSSGFDFDPVQAIGTLWLLGAGATLMFYLLSYASLIIATRRTAPAPEDWNDSWNRLLAANGVRKKVRLRVHERLGPMLCRLPGGYAVVVPSAIWRNLSETQRRAVLEHEIAHIRRGDIWKTFLARLAVVPHWFNPMAWKAVRHFEEAAEWACDRKMADSRSRVVDYAKALLQLAEPAQPLPLGASLARGAALSPRIDRLVNGRRKGDSTLKCLGFFLLISAVAFATAIRFDVVAQEESVVSNQEADPEFAEKLATLSDDLSGSGDQLDTFRKTLATPAGQIAMKDRAARAADHLRKESAANVLENYIYDHFEKSGDGDDAKLVLLSGQESWRERLLKQHEFYRKDIDQMIEAFAETKASITGESETDKLLIRFLDQEGAAPLLYAFELQKVARPDVYGIAEQLGSVFSSDGEGNFVIPESRAEAASEFGMKSKNMMLFSEALHEELAILADELSDADELHERLKAATSQSLFASFIAYQVGEKEKPKSLNSALDEALKNIDEAFVDRGDGLHLIDDKRDELKKTLEAFDAVLDRSERLRDPVLEFASRIPEKDDLHRAWRKFVESEIGLVTLIHKVEIGSADVGELFKQSIGKALEPAGEEGKQRVSEAKAAEVEAYLQKALRTVREARRKGRQFDRIAERIEDAELRELLLSSAGKMIAGQSIRRKFETQEFDGLSFWIEQHFNRDNEGRLTAKASAGEAISGVLEDAAEIASNLKSDF